MTTTPSTPYEVQRTRLLIELANARNRNDVAAIADIRNQLANLRNSAK